VCAGNGTTVIPDHHYIDEATRRQGLHHNHGKIAITGSPTK
jgi:hypothetical protein